jgi:Flp pilus assembly protein TadD
MQVTRGDAASGAATHRPRVRLPAIAEELRLPLHERSQARLRERWGFDLNAPDALERAEALLAEAPADADRLLLAAAVRSSRGDDPGALAAARQAAELQPGSARAHTTLATLLGRAADGSGSLEHAHRAGELDPTDPTALYNRGVAAWVNGDRAAARDDFRRAAERLGVPVRARWRWWRRPR